MQPLAGRMAGTLRWEIVDSRLRVRYHSWLDKAVNLNHSLLDVSINSFNGLQPLAG